jgi:hypothetical protein
MATSSSDKSDDKTSASKSGGKDETASAPPASSGPVLASAADNQPETEGDRELARLGVNPALDNRTGDQRPPTDLPLKPQQVHGGYPGDDSEFEDPPSGKPTDPTRAEGPHGRGPQAGPSSED